MSYPIQPYNQNNGALANQRIDRAVYGGNNGGGGDLIGSLLGLANRMMTEMLQKDPGPGGISSFMSSDPNNPHLQVFGISSMNVTQMSREPDGQPHIFQAYDQRCMGPGGICQTKKALRDPDRGIDKMQVGYFVGDQSEIIEHQLEQSSGQHQKQIKQRSIVPNESNFPHQRRTQAIQRPPQLPQQPYQYYPQQQQRQQQQHRQFPFYTQQPQQALPTPRPFQYY
jgi:hypothetical protein